MNKSGLTKVLRKEYDLDPKKADEIVDKVFQTMSQALMDGDRVEIRGFGSFTVRDHNGYTGRNPKTGEEINVKPKKIPFFRCGKELKEQLKQR